MEKTNQNFAMKIEEKTEHGMPLIYLENDYLKVTVAPDVGGKIISIQDLETGHEFLWTNQNLPLEKLPAGSEYDPNFYGGIDELIPNDIPEELNGVLSPDHGELWTLSLDYIPDEKGVSLSGILPLSGLRYRRNITLCPDEPGIELQYKIENPTKEQRRFLWKFHAAINIEPDDEIFCPAKTAMVADAEWSRWTSYAPFHWPNIENQRADLIPPKGNELDFLYLYDLTDGSMGWRRRKKGLAFLYCFDTNVFPYGWYFASYGGFYNHYVAVLEPCTTMPCSVNEAYALNQCSVLEPGETMETIVRIYAGSEKQLSNHLPR